MKNQSYIKRLFLLLSSVITIAILLIGIVIYMYAKSKIENELVYVNQNSLKQIGKGTSLRLEEYHYLSRKIANDSRIVDILGRKAQARGGKEEEPQEVARGIQKILDDYVWTFSEFNPLVYSYVLCMDGQLYPGSYSDPVEFDAMKDKIDFEILSEENREFAFEGPIENEEARGVYKYSFWVIQEIKDYISGDIYGYVILNISEKNLFDTYKELIASEKNFFVTDETGIVISEKNKQKIGKFCGVDIGKVSGEGYRESIIIGEDGNKSYFLYYEIPQTGWYLVETIGTSSLLQSFQTIKWFIAGILTIAAVFLWLVLKFFLRAILIPVMTVKEKMEEVSGGNLLVSFEYNRKDEFGEMAKAFNYMVNELQESLKAVKEEEKKKRLAEQDFLRAQINPHFIYNTLSSIRFFVEMNRNEEADDMLFHFSKILRKSLSSANDFVALATELETITDYVELQKKRYKDSFTLEYDVPEEIFQDKVPVFILQPIVENAIFHGIQEGQLCRILISGYHKGEKLYLRISDNGRGMKLEEVDQLFEKSSSMSKVGVNNVHDRIQLNFGEEYGLKVESIEGEGTTVIFILPISGEGQNAEDFNR